ncbi:FxsA family protein [Ornithinimicrobium cavernae]|uniref:FxsA family protein n=1 Tax=Ornithinimicrobium cavernae TaxID=2666047 RepID=UPI00137B8550|nr:FxsA family protein [Ornithinimicrobium cavernae]
MRLIVAAFLLLVLLEILLLLAVGRAIGPWWTIGLLVLFVLAGLYLVRRESGRTWKALRQAVDTGRMPGRELADAMLVLVGGLFLLLPGFLSDLVGIFLILPFTRTLSRRVLAVFIGSRMPPVVVTGGPARSGPASGYGTGRRDPGGTGAAPGPRQTDDIIEGEIVSEDPPTEQ